jgi:hypothetical protein
MDRKDLRALSRVRLSEARALLEQSRYEKHSLESTRALIEAIGDRSHGVMKWVKLY